jgi:sugar/nucleoside kinase (ribokinase family)
MNEAETLEIQLNVLAEQAPAIPERYRDSRFVFLAATHPRLQQDMASAFPGARLVVADTRDLWITNEKEALTRLLSRVHGVVLNDGEARLFTNEQNLITAGRRILGFGPQFAIVKKGEHGATLVTHDSIVSLPSFPTDRVRDPTGAGDSFAGGMMGYLAAQGEFKPVHLHRAMAYGTVAASFAIEGFSVQAIEKVTRPQIDARLAEYVAMLRFD